MVLEVVHENKEVEVVETQCKKVPDEECNLETVVVKKSLEETVCKTVPENKCETVIKQEKDNECKIVDKNDCIFVDKPSTKYIQVRIIFPILYYFKNLFSKVSVKPQQDLSVRKKMKKNAE